MVDFKYAMWSDEQPPNNTHSGKADGGVVGPGPGTLMRPLPAAAEGEQQ
eukprot:gene6541-12853_t